MGDPLSWKRALEELESSSDPEIRRKLIGLLHQEINRGQTQPFDFSEKLQSFFLQTADPWLSTEIKRLQNRLRTRKILGRDLLRLREPPLGDGEQRQLWADLKGLREAYDKTREKGQGLETLYDIHEQIGEGGMSVVFKAVRQTDNAEVAIKYLRRQLLNNPSTAARFRRECRLCTSFDHPNIIRAFEFGEHDGSAFLVMEYLPLSGLDGFIGHTEFEAPHAMAAVRQAAEALAYIHEKGVIHRDVKLSNLLVSMWQPAAVGGSDDQIHVKLSDFGLCKEVAADSFTRAGTKMGTDFYSAPELLYDPSRVDHRADIYSLGVALYRLLSGGEFPGEEYQPLHAIFPRLTPEVDDVVKTCLEKDRDRRFPSAIVVAGKLQELSKP